ncbi:MAG: sialate O-acetylesterase [Bacteroidales bacterium]
MKNDLRTALNNAVGVCMLAFFSSATGLHAKVVPATLYSDNMVIQQKQQELPVWGKAKAGKTVKITPSWDSRSYSVKADKDGKWRTTIRTAAAGGPYSIIFDDGEKTEIQNVMLGEVWLCSGQSNMEMPMKGFPGQPLEQEANMDIMCSSNTKIRLFNVENSSAILPAEDVKGKWGNANPETVRDFSATAYYFGRLLQATLGVPVGLITADWGGSTIEAWMSAHMLADFPEVALPVAETDIIKKNQTPTTLYNGMISPIKGFGMQGMIWYQGESNNSNPQKYEKLFGCFITSLRKEWEIGEFPFYFCQIAPYAHYGEDNSAYLREAQFIVDSRISNTGMAVLLDAGMRGCIHPSKKRVAGERLALQALTNTYGMTGAAGQSPVYKDMVVSNDTVMLTFDRAPMGLTSYYKTMRLFTVSGEDQKFYPAKAWIKNNQVYLVSDKVKQPVAARYAFENFVEGELFGVEGLPVSSFRTDHFINTKPDSSK